MKQKSHNNQYNFVIRLNNNLSMFVEIIAKKFFWKRYTTAIRYIIAYTQENRKNFEKWLENIKNVDLL